jgi:hypothetical protein
VLTWPGGAPACTAEAACSPCPIRSLEQPHQLCLLCATLAEIIGTPAAPLPSAPCRPSPPRSHRGAQGRVSLGQRRKHALRPPRSHAAPILGQCPRWPAAAAPLCAHPRRSAAAGDQRRPPAGTAGTAAAAAAAAVPGTAGDGNSCRVAVVAAAAAAAAAAAGARRLAASASAAAITARWQPASGAPGLPAQSHHAS